MGIMSGRETYRLMEWKVEGGEWGKREKLGGREREREGTVAGG